MKKLLLVLLVVTLASFLFVGCLGTGTIVDDDDVTPPPVQAVTIVIEDQYPADVKEFIRADVLKVTVTFADAIPADQAVTFQAKEAWAGTPKIGLEADLFPDTTRKVWSTDNPATTAVEVGYDFNNIGDDPLGLGDLLDCDEICLYVTIVDCCDVLLDEVFTEVVKLDDSAPELSLDITFIDCGECVVPGGVKFTFAPEDYELECLPVTCCDDDCSGIAGWEISDAATCPECETLSGTDCPADTYECGCLLYASGDEGDLTRVYELDFTFTDNVGNAIEDTWTITVDTDSVTTFTNTNVDADPALAAGVWNIPYTACGPQ